MATFPHSIDYIIREIDRARELTPSVIRRIIESAEVEMHDLTPWFDYDHSAMESYGRKLIYDGGHFEVMAMSWSPGDYSAIHDHGYAQWGAVKTFGPSDHAVYHVESDGITLDSRVRQRPDSVIAVDHDLVHQMGNATSHSFMSLHVYGCLESKENITGDARLFNPRNKEVQRVGGGVFFALPEAEILSRADAPGADYPTWLRNQVELTRRVLRAERAGVYHGEIPPGALIEELFQRDHNEPHLAAAQDRQGGELVTHELEAAARLEDELLDDGTLDRGSFDAGRFSFRRARVG